MTAVSSRARRPGKSLLPLSALAAASFVAAGSAVRPVAAGEGADVTPRRFFHLDDVPDSLLGRSKQLKVRFVSPDDAEGIAMVERFFGPAAAVAPGVYTLPDSVGVPVFSYVVMRPFAVKTGATVGTYRVGYWPGEAARRRIGVEGFIEVTEENQDTPVSAHFRLRDFLTKNQPGVWPKYLVLNERLVDKLELVITELRRTGYRADRLPVISGFRTPDYNRTVRAAGAVADSRHQYGDAADVIVDSDGNGRMDDLNRDGRVNARDLALFAGAVERVEALHPSLVGGLGVYRSTGTASGFLHIDVRGERTRWGSY